MLSKQELKQQIILNHLVKDKRLSTDKVNTIFRENGLIDKLPCNGAIFNAVHELALNFRDKGIKMFSQMNPFIVSDELLRFSEKLLSPIYDEYGENVGWMILHPKYHRSELI